MTKLWWAQIKSVIRLEMKKTFFARRGLWIYVLALLPLLPFIGHGLTVSRMRARSSRIAHRSEKPLTYQDLLLVKSGMTSDEVIALLGKPPARSHWNQRMPATVSAPGTGGSGTPVNLSSAYNLNGIYTDDTPFNTEGVDGAGFTYSANLLTPNRIFNGVQFNFGPANQLDAVYGSGRPISLPAGQFSTLHILATGIRGPVLSQAITVTYTDSSTSTFTQNFSDWCDCSTNPGQQPGESFAVVMPYRLSDNGTQDARSFHLYGYTFALNPAKTVQSLTLPQNRDVVVLAATLTTQSQGTQVSAAGPARFVNVPHESYHYSDGVMSDLFLELSEGKVVSVRLEQFDSPTQEPIVFAGVFQFFYLRLAIFFGCLGIFMNLFRGEILDKSLHFYFLAPIRREVLMVGKFLAGLLATCVIFVTSELLQIIVFTWSFSPNARDLYLYQNHGLAHSAAYLGVTALACLGYGAFFLAAGMLFRNPILPAAAILVWEAVNPFLPALLKKFSVIYYLKSLCPVDIPSPPGMPPLLSLLISNPDPVSTPVAILGIVSVALLVLYASSFQVRRMEINYTTE
jgi:ABC-type transport system involved in multi-copper enzyme maturation permease subunit